MINWGILGYGRMGLSFSKVIKETSNSKLIYIGSRTANNKSENILKGYDDVITVSYKHLTLPTSPKV